MALTADLKEAQALIEEAPLSQNDVPTLLRDIVGLIKGLGQEKAIIVGHDWGGALAWVFAMLFAGHYLHKFILLKFGFDLKKHLEVIVIGIVLITTLPVLYKIFFGKRKQPEE